MFVTIRRFGLALVLLGGWVNPAISNEIARACLSSERGAGQQRLCKCIQQAADKTLSRRDQRRAADFFADPDLAQSVKRSDSSRDDAFWERYEGFGALAGKYCRRR